MDKNDPTVIDALKANAQELQQSIERHCELVSAVVNGQAADCSMQELMDMCPKRSREQALEAVIREAVDEIEATRKAFKSKQLERLRKRLIDVLVDTG